VSEPDATLVNTIVAGNTPSNCNGATDGGNNLSFPDTTCPGTNGDPRLAPLADRGGPTLTQALEPGSAAIDAVPASGAGCEATDQRGVARPVGQGCDIGAFESRLPGVATAAPVEVLATLARAGGQVDANGAPTTWRVEYGTDTSYGRTTPVADAGSGPDPVTVTGELTPLTELTGYRYRLVASNVDGTVAGADMAFTTLALPKGVPPSDTLAPSFLSASMNPRTWAVNRRGTREVAVQAQRRRRRVRRGTTIRYRLSEPARVVFTIQRARPGRRVRVRCRRPTRSNRRRPRCTRWVRVGRFAAHSVAGANRKRFSGRIGRRTLRRGRHRLVLRATDAAGNRSRMRRLRFRIVRAR
jgi:hypothetical protein